VQPLAAFARAVVVAGIGSLVCVWLRTPLPWLIGSIVAVALVNMLRGRLTAPTVARDAGQWAIGVALGLYFAPDVVREIVRLGPWIAASVAVAIMLGWLGAWLLARLADTGAATSYFAMAIGGASEMAAQAERHGARVDRVAAAHSLRILIVALVVPLSLGALNVRGLDPYVPLAREFAWDGFAVLVAVTAGAALVMRRVDAPNAWMIGPLAAAAVITATGPHVFGAADRRRQRRAVADRGFARRAIQPGVLSGSAALSGVGGRDHRGVPGGWRDFRRAGRRRSRPALVDRAGRHDARRHW
jgi:uncharacterized protein